MNLQKHNAGYAEGIVSIAVNAALFALKMWAGVVSGSAALIADAWHTLSDSASSVVVVAATKLAARKPSTRHPFGQGRWEQIAALFMAFLLGAIACSVLRESILRFVHVQGAQFGTLAVVVTLVSIAAKEMLAQYAFYLNRKNPNAAVKADGWHHRSDALSSVPVLAGILLAERFWWTDSVVGVVIALILFYAMFKIARETIVKLLGEEPSPELTMEIAAIARSVYPDDLQMHHFHVHNYVNYQEITFHIKLRNHLTIEEGHRIATDIENAVQERLHIAATVHVEPLGITHEGD
jgi:cation diffusion facilitator family transporter